MATPGKSDWGLSKRKFSAIALKSRNDDNGLGKSDFGKNDLGKNDLGKFIICWIPIPYLLDMGFHVALHNGAGKKSSKGREECENHPASHAAHHGRIFFADSSK